MMRRKEIVQTRYQTLEVWKSDKATEFRVAGAVHAFHHRDRFLTGLAWDMIAASALMGASERPRSVLMLGLAGGTAFRVLRHLLPDCDLVAVDIDAEIVDLARKHMELDALGIEPRQQAGEHGRRALQLREALVGQGIEHVSRVELAAHEQARSRVQRGHEHGAQTEDVGHRQIGVRAVGGCELARLR